MAANQNTNLVEDHRLHFPARLTAGYQSFLDERFIQEQSRYAELAETGQTPKFLLIGCCDSRVAPETIFDMGPGELFVVRNIANLVPPNSSDEQTYGASAALEYAVQALKVEHIVVMGHGRCGGVRAFADAAQQPLSVGDHVGKWIRQIEPAARACGGRGRNEELETYAQRLGFESVRQSIRNLRSYPCVRTLEKEGRLTLHGAFFAIATGVLMLLDPVTGQFLPAVSEVPARPNLIRCS